MVSAYCVIDSFLKTTLVLETITLIKHMISANVVVVIATASIVVAPVISGFFPLLAPFLNLQSGRNTQRLAMHALRLWKCDVPTKKNCAGA